jgi:hypothetical protein
LSCLVLFDVVLAARAWVLDAVRTPNGVIVVAAVVCFLLCVGAVTTLRWLVRLELQLRRRSRERRMRRRESRTLRRALQERARAGETPDGWPAGDLSPDWGSGARITPISAAGSRTRESLPTD